jgi:DNA-binding GntR family transcriptional regulator
MRSTTKSAAGPRLRSASASLAESVYAQIRNEIITCAFPPGARLSEAELAARFRVSKTPVREALGELRSQGFVRTFPRSGYQVAPVTMADVENLLDLRAIIEGGAAEVAAERITDAELKRLERLADIAYDRSEQPSLLRFVRANREFHAAIAAAAKNRRLLDLVVGLLDELERLFYLGARNRDINAEVRGEHRRIVNVLRRRDGTAARKLMIEHNRMTLDGLRVLLSGDDSRPRRAQAARGRI